ncbi:2'-5'-oligoadenylate synthase 1A-like [Rhincodon typus]|uniref:2'-5'-oligoadenylate synthase 1A-like n=1 Tax=Rhincodon typus TaxID=259920 RepID=UPI00202FE2D5|nr:2'-5'-oligoadenylate synthase 1A-like [Rhincodon typus]XP_048451312.1 2'-5'-oligoadenylate synthase 1A-like [Rhincodon typus]
MCHRIMQAIKPYNCIQCGNDFASQTALKHHFQAKHIGRVYCDKCGIEVLREKLKEHEETVHDQDKHKLVCENPYWDKPLQREDKFVASEKSVSCRMCGRVFGTFHSREQHERQQHHFTASQRARMSTAFSPDSVLDLRSSVQLQKFMETYLQPEMGLVRMACAGEIEKFIDLIQECCPTSVTRIIKGGSYFKGTDTRDWSDIDIVMFSSSFMSLDDCKEKILSVLSDLEYNLKLSVMTNRILMEKKTSLSLRFQFKCFKGLHIHHFDVMLCYDLLGSTPTQDVKRNLYRQLFNCGDDVKIQLYSISLLQYQVDFVKASTVGVKDLIRLVKHWFRTSFAKRTEANRFRRLPSSYTMELITIHVWQLAGKPIFFSFIQGLRAVLKFLVNCTGIFIIWYDHYDKNFHVVKKALQKQSRPFVLDPANPTLNVCENSNAWDEVTHVARQSLLKPLLSGVQAKVPWLFTNNW